MVNLLKNRNSLLETNHLEHVEFWEMNSWPVFSHIVVAKSVSSAAQSSASRSAGMVRSSVVPVIRVYKSSTSSATDSKCDVGSYERETKTLSAAPLSVGSYMSETPM